MAKPDSYASSTAKVAPEGDEVVLTMDEQTIGLLTDKKAKQRTIAAIFFVIFADFLGTVLLMPGAAIMTQLAKGGPLENIAVAMNTTNAAATKQQLFLRQTVGIGEATMPLEGPYGSKALFMNKAANPQAINAYAFEDIPDGIRYSMASNRKFRRASNL